MENRMQAEISVVMPVYNGGEYLKIAVDSLTAQTFTAFELILVDDGSDADTLEILAQYEREDERIRVFRQSHKGAAAARNTGLLKAQGTFVIFLDADDIFGEELLEKIVKKGKKTGADVILFGAKQYDDRTGKVLNAPWYFRKERLPARETFSGADLDGRLLEITIPAPWTRAYRRDYLLREQIFFQDLPNSNDIFFAMVSLAAAEKISAVAEDLLFYRIFREGSLQNCKTSHPLCFIDAYEATYDELHRRGIYDRVSRGFCNRVVSGCDYQLNHISDEQVRWQIIEALCSERFLRMKIFDHQEEDEQVVKIRNKIQALPYALSVHRKWGTMHEQGDAKQVVAGEDFIEKKVSVIIPVYHTEKYLRECMDAILGQSLKDLEILCIDDGSTDRSMEILREYAAKDRRVSVYHQENAGQGTARNRGLKRASGEYVYFMDSDDILLKEALEELYQRSKEEDLDVLYFNAEAFFDNEEVRKKHPEYEDYYDRAGKYPRQCPGREMFVRMWELKEYRVLPGIQFFKREFLEREGLQFYPGIVHEDNDFTFRAMLLANRTGYMDKTYFMRRVREDSTMTANIRFAHVYGYFKSFLNMLQFVQTYHCPEEMLKPMEEAVSTMLECTKRRYDELSDLEKCAAMGLAGREKYLFYLFVEREAETVSKLYRTYSEKSEINRKLQITYGEKYDRGLEIKRLKKEISSIRGSKTYRLARMIGLPVRVLRRMLGRIRSQKSGPEKPGLEHTDSQKSGSEHTGSEKH